MFNFTVYQAGELYGHPCVHAVLLNDDSTVSYVVMFGTCGIVSASVVGAN